jgi:hypothetical protein
MRRTVSLILALCLFVGGWFAVVYMLFFAPGWRGIIVLAAGFAGILGTLWLREDFINATPDKD